MNGKDEELRNDVKALAFHINGFLKNNTGDFDKIMEHIDVMIKDPTVYEIYFNFSELVKNIQNFNSIRRQLIDISNSLMKLTE